MYNTPELLWFLPTKTHLEDPSVHICNDEVPPIGDVVKNLWYSNHGDEDDRRVVIFNWKSLEAQKKFMETCEYVEWCLPFTEMTNHKTLVGQYQGFSSVDIGTPNPNTTVEPIFNATSTDFLYFENRRAIPLIRDYIALLTNCLDCVGSFWGLSVDPVNKFTFVLIVGWSTLQPVHDENAGYVYCSLINHARVQSLRHLTYVEV